MLNLLLPQLFLSRQLLPQLFLLRLPLSKLFLLRLLPPWLFLFRLLLQLLPQLLLSLCMGLGASAVGNGTL
jgi:hypothetical protein